MRAYRTLSHSGRLPGRPRGNRDSYDGLNLAERFFAEITEKAIRRGSHTSVKELEAAINAYIEAREPKPFTWTATADAILQKLKRFCDRTSGTGH